MAYCREQQCGYVTSGYPSLRRICQSFALAGTYDGVICLEQGTSMCHARKFLANFELFVPLILRTALSYASELSLWGPEHLQRPQSDSGLRWLGA